MPGTLGTYIMSSSSPKRTVTITISLGANAFSIPIFEPVNPNDLNIPVLTQDDLIQDVYSGDTWTYYQGGYGWFAATGPELLPGHAYWYFSKNAEPFDWVFTEL